MYLIAKDGTIDANIHRRYLVISEPSLRNIVVGDVCNA